MKKIFVGLMLTVFIFLGLIYVYVEALNSTRIGIVYLHPYGLDSSWYKGFNRDSLWSKNIELLKSTIEKDFRLMASSGYDLVITYVGICNLSTVAYNMEYLKMLASKNRMDFMVVVAPHGQRYYTPLDPAYRDVVWLCNRLAEKNIDFAVFSITKNPEEVKTFYNHLPPETRKHFVFHIDHPYISHYKGYTSWFKGKVFVEIYELPWDARKTLEGIPKNAYVATGVPKTATLTYQAQWSTLKIYVENIRLSGYIPVVWCFDDTNDGTGETYGVYNPQTGKLPIL